MLRVLTAEQMKQAEKAAVNAGTSYEQLMENAGTAAAKEILAWGQKKAPREHTALLLCGRGNNAGDAFVIARLLAWQGWQVEWLPLCGDNYSELAELNLERLPEAVRRKTHETADYKACVVVDGVFGTGFKGTLSLEIQRVFHVVNTQKDFRVALDMPSGLNCDTGEISPNTFKADLTVTFGAYKPGLLKEQSAEVCGEIRCLDIGL